MGKKHQCEVPPKSQIGKAFIDTICGAKSSAIIYNVAETAKASGRKVYDYVEYLLTEIPKHEDGANLTFLRDLLVPMVSELVGTLPKIQ